MNVTLVGRPGTIVKHKHIIMTTLVSSKIPQLPKTVPKPKDGYKTLYTVYISEKHWNKVEPRLAKDPEDLLIIEGHGFLDKKVPGISVLSKSVTTKSIVNEQKEAQKKAQKLDELSL